ncbi:MAG: hypothetical protein R3255_05985 [Candidatus Lokiarchaeia archaeon]|nr:hypothetical protein [Candidatus Lokiarchaeia archaeon]
MKFPTLELNKYFSSQYSLEGIFSVFGDFGVGKTTFALQTALNSLYQGNVIIYVYTKPNFPSEKILLINKHSLDILDNIIFIQTTSFTELSSIVFNFEFLILHYLNNHKPKLEMIIIDSITNLYRLELTKDKKEKNYNLNYKLNQMLANLAYLNQSYGIEILVINEISRRSFDDLIIDVESGGNVMKYWITYNLKISRTNKLNERRLLFNNLSDSFTLEFIQTIREDGFK